MLELFKVNPPTAYNILSEFVDLRPGDFVIQNGANSAVGIIPVVNAEQLLIYKSFNILVDFLGWPSSHSNCLRQRSQDYQSHS